MLNSIKGTNGRISTSARDVQSEAGVALSKIRAVNGSFDDDTTMKELMRPNEVTRWLGGKKNIMDSKVSIEKCLIIQPYNSPPWY